MGKFGRLVAIFLPMGMSLVALVMMALMFLGGISKGNTSLSNLYFFKADLSQFKSTINSSPSAATYLNNLINGGKGDKSSFLNNLVGGNGAATVNNTLFDYYQIYLFNYCAGNANNGSSQLEYCSPRMTHFVFDPIEEWGLNNTIVQDTVPKAVNSAIKTYKGAIWLMVIVFFVAIASIALSVGVGIFAICSRAGSCVTAVVAGVAFGATLIAVATATATYVILVNALNGALKSYNVHLTVGGQMMSFAWITVAITAGALAFWTVSICCCSGKSSRRNKKDVIGGAFGPSTGRGYHPLDDSAHQPLHQPETEMHTFNSRGGDTAYEPYREVHPRV